MKVKDYGDMLSQVKGKPCLGYVIFGSYQGEWVALLDAGASIELWKGYYGSCSGCDFIEAERNWDTGEIDDESARNHFKEDRPFIEIPKDIIKRMTKDDFKTIFPANIREGIYDFEEGEEEMFKAIKESVN